MDNLPSKKCIFCGRGQTTKEDVWPTWLTRYVPRDIPSYFNSVSLISPEAELTTTRKKMPGDPRSRRAKCVCAKCNNEWMSGLQERAKPVVLKLATGRETTLTPHDQELLTSWARSATEKNFGRRNKLSRISKYGLGTISGEIGNHIISTMLGGKSHHSVRAQQNPRLKRRPLCLAICSCMRRTPRVQRSSADLPSRNHSPINS
jgi:hypothetical protein